MKKEEIIYGFQPVVEAIKSGKEIEKLVIQSTIHYIKQNELKKLAALHEIPFQFVPREKLNKITHQNHQGIIAFVSPVEYIELDQLIPFLFESGKAPLILILDRITDVRNLGSIARTAECAGADAIILPSKGSAMINSIAIKTSAGALNRINVCRVPGLKETIRLLKDSGIRIIGATEKTENLYFNANYESPLAIVMGSEEKGISDELLNLCDDKVKIPMLGEVQSLNVAVATGVILFEVVKQRTS